MSIYVKIGKKILKNPNIIRPHVKTKDISELNFKKMKDMGMEKIIFTIDNSNKKGEEDFGMIPLEVMAYGTPVIAYKKGGALETVVENLENVGESSGLFFSRQSKNSVKKAIGKFHEIENTKHIQFRT